MRLGEEQHPHDAAEREWDGHQHDQRVSPALKVHDQEQIDEDYCECYSAEQAGIAFPHRLHLAAKGHVHGLCGGRLIHLDERVDVLRSGIQVTTLNLRVDVE